MKRIYLVPLTVCFFVMTVRAQVDAIAMGGKLKASYTAPGGAFTALNKATRTNNVPDGSNASDLSVSTNIDYATGQEGATIAPNIRADEFTGTTLACGDVTNLTASAITTTTVNLNWDITPGAIGYEYAVTTNSTDPGSGTLTTDNFVTSVTGLIPGTIYYAQVRSKCAEGAFGNWFKAPFTTLCDPISGFPFTETFETSSPTRFCWKKDEYVTGALPWNYGAGPGDITGTTNTAHGGVFNANFFEGDYGTINVTKLVTPKLDLSSVSAGVQVRFWYVNENWNGDQDELRVYYKTSAGGAWTLITGAVFTTDQADWTEVTLAVPSPSNDYYIAFEATEKFGHGVAIDDVTVEAFSPSCLAPLTNSFSALATSPTSATISWGAASPTPSNGYEWKVVLTGAGVNGSAVASGSTAAGVLSANVTGLTTGTNYDLFVRSSCGGSDFSNYTGAKTFFLQDDAAGAISLTVNAGCTGAIYTNLGATRSNVGTPEAYPSCSGSGVAPVWFKFTAPASGAVRISTDLGSDNSLSDSKVGLFSIPLPSDVNDYSKFTIISCDEDGGSALGFGFMSVVYATGLTSGTTYYIAVDKFNNSIAGGTFCIAVDELRDTMLASASNTCSTPSESPFGSNANYTGWQPLVSENSKLMALVRNVAGGEVDDYSITQNINLGPVRQDITSKEYYLDRNFRITNSNATNVDVQFFFLNTELAALYAKDSAKLTSLRVTHQSGATCQADFLASNGINSELVQTANGTANGVSWIQVATSDFSNFYIHSTRSPVTTNVFLQGPYNSGLARHKDVTPQWATALTSFALNQPYNTAAFGNYTGNESVANGFFTSNNSNTRDITDWILLELKDGSNNLVARRAAFVREDGKIIGIDGDSSITFPGVASGSYYVTIRHRNHLGISTQNLIPLTAKALGVTTNLTTDFDFRTQSDANIFGNALAYKVISGNNVMIGGNSSASNTISNNKILYSTPGNDPAVILALLGVTTNTTFGSTAVNVYNNADVNLDGRVLYSTPGNDPALILVVLGNTVNQVLEQRR